MIAVIFETWPAEGQEQHYLDVAQKLFQDLQKLDGFISVERFSSLAEPRKILSLSFWRDEEAISQWRNHPSHRSGQKQGRGKIFKNYRIRVGQIVRDYGLEERREAPPDSYNFHSNLQVSKIAWC